jgi:tRNA/tmRNA/rRNA uracil-C5-methylase (TrmA/RlmC/RlmD family)
MPLAPGDTLSVQIDAIAFGGEGIARHEGRVFFIPFTAVGDVAEVRVEELKKNFGRAALVALTTPGPHRATPPCPYYGPCGGCQYQHLDYDEELRIKAAQVGDALRRIGKIAEPPVLPILPSPQIYGYRNRITVHAADGKIGFHRAGSREVVDVARCAIAMPEVNDALFELRRPARRPAEGHFSLRHPGLPPSAFHQVNQFLLEPLRDLVAAWAQGEERRLVEGYCGGGFFTAALAPSFDSGVGIESDPRGLRDARRLGLAHITWIEGRVEQHLSAALADAETVPTLVLLDPPREGLEGATIATLLDRRPRRILYVSCSPATLARDLEKLSPAYAPARVQPVDLFPRTAQIETVTELRLK